jgi:hypothetical protein
VQATNTHPRFEVVADGSYVGAGLLGELSERLGLTGELGRRANRGVRAGAYDRGQVQRDLVVMLADGGDCVSDLASLRNQPKLFASAGVPGQSGSGNRASVVEPAGRIRRVRPAPRGWLARRPACRAAAPCGPHLGGRAAARAGLAKRPGDPDHPGDDSW